MSRIKKIIKFYSGKRLGTPSEKIKKIVLEAEVVSFDIFDTLVKRNVSTPQEIFSIVEKIYNSDNEEKINDYQQERVKAEIKARQIATAEEIDLYEIYKCIKYSEEVKQCLMKIEIETEIAYCVPNLAVQHIYHHAIENNKHIIITSDMYLPEKVIISILDKCGYMGYEKLYLSSKYKKTKSTGSIFDLIVDEYVSFTGKIVHIGDHIKGDFIRPKEKKISAVLIDGNKNNLSFWKKSCKEFKTSFDYRNLYSLINNYVDESAAIPQKIGYEVLGPILYGFCSWLKEQVERDKIEKIFFLSREGKIFQKAYNELFPNSKIPQTYLKVSRQSLLVPMLHRVNSYDELIDTLKSFMHIPQLKTICEVCSLDHERFQKELKKIGLREETEIYKVPEHLKSSLYNIIHYLGADYFKKQYEYAGEYLKNNDFTGKVAIVDIGWSGTMQRCLKNFADNHTEITGYYLGVNNLEKKDFYNGMCRKGYLFQPDKNTEYGLMVRFTLQIFEILFLNQDGSVCKYLRKNNTVVPCLADSEYQSNEGNLIDSVQKCAISMLPKLAENYYGKDIPVKYIMQAYASFAVRPELSVLKVFQNFRFLDGNTLMLFPQRSIFYYCIHIEEFKRELNANVCKVWFFKWLLKINVPYYKILKLASNCGFKSKYERECYKN